MKKTKKEGPKIDNPAVFVAIFILFLVSFALILYGVIFPKKVANDIAKESENAGNVVNEEVDLNEFFKDSDQNQYLSGEGAEFAVDDPFVEQCAPTSGDNQPAFNSFTVCVR